MGVRKIYQAIGFKDLDTYEMVKGVKTLIQFRGTSSSPFSKGTYTTTDPNVIMAMDHSTSLNISFKCIFSETFEDENMAESTPKATPKADSETDDGAGGGKGEGPGEDEGEFTDVPDIKTVQAARDYLAAEPYKVPISKIQNGAAVKAKAAELKLRFVDLP